MEAIDDKILKRAAGGDLESFEVVYRASSGYVYSLALRITGNVEDAQEVTQDVFMKIHDSLQRFEFKSSFKTWIYRIAVNTALNKAKSRGREQSRRVHSEEVLELQIVVGTRPSAKAS